MAWYVGSHPKETRVQERLQIEKTLHRENQESEKRFGRIIAQLQQENGELRGQVEKEQEDQSIFLLHIQQEMEAKLKGAEILGKGEIATGEMLNAIKEEAIERRKRQGGDPQNVQDDIDDIHDSFTRISREIHRRWSDF